MLLIHGHKYDLDFKCRVKAACPKCRRSPVGLYYGRKKLTLYWIPTFTLAEHYVLKCPACNDDTLYEIKPEYAARLQQDPAA
jgi:hypothetical protein